MVWGIAFAFAMQLFAQAPGPTELPLQIIVVRSQEEARQVLDRLKKGADFSQIAKEQSIDPTAADRGFLGTIQLNQLRPELRDAVNGLGAGQLSSVVSLPSGYAILRVMRDGESPVAKGADPSRDLALAASGAIKLVLDIDGFAEAETALLRFPKAPGWNSDPASVCDMRNQSLASVTTQLKDRLAADATSAVPARAQIDSMQMHFALGQLYAYRGDMHLAIEQYLAAYNIAQSRVPGAVLQTEEALGIAYLHQSEMENGAYRTPGSKDLFPMRPESAYKNMGDSKKAVEYFLKYLENKPDEMEVRWLLNIAYMTLGRWPTDVPSKYLIPESAFQSKEDVGRFVDVAVESGLKSFSAAGGVIADDFENNGLLDVVTSAFDSCGHMHYFHNEGDGTFTDQTEKAGLSGQVGGLNMFQADYNNDGCIDILILRGAWEFAQRMSLLRNNCDGTFTDVTEASGLAKVLTTSQAAVWADINNDGLLDLFVGNESQRAQLFLNKGDGTFEDISHAAGVDGDGSAYTKAVAAADYDNDGFVDFYVSNLNGANFLYHNNGDNTFTNVAGKAGVPGSGRGFATWFFDYDNDGLPDLFATSYFPSVDETARTYLGLPHNVETLKLYKNLGNGTFRDATAETGLDKVFMPMGANFGDIDNDGYLDIYLGTGNPSYGSLVPNVLLRNHDGKYFVDVTTSSGTGQLHKGHGIAFADLGNNGNEDIVAVVGGATLGDRHALRVFKNPGHGNDWITLKLVGVKTNRSAIGARIKVTVENAGGGTRSIYRTVGSGGSFGASPLQQHIGLGKAATIVNIEIFWPVSKSRQIFAGVEKNQFLEIRELENKYSKLDRKPFQLGGAKSTALSGAAAGHPAHSN
jgi:tetratricopeptide (TPR) repeat protein